MNSGSFFKLPWAQAGLRARMAACGPDRGRDVPLSLVADTRPQLSSSLSETVILHVVMPQIKWNKMSFLSFYALYCSTLLITSRLSKEKRNKSTSFTDLYVQSPRPLL